jgi:hypothetical protein
MIGAAILVAIVVLLGNAVIERQRARALRDAAARAR